MTEQPRIWFDALAGLMGCAGGVDGIYAGAPLLAFLGGFFGAICLMSAATKYKDTLRRRLGYLREPEIGPMT